MGKIVSSTNDVETAGNPYIISEHWPLPHTIHQYYFSMDQSFNIKAMKSLQINTEKNPIILGWQIFLRH